MDEHGCIQILFTSYNQIKKFSLGNLDRALVSSGVLALIRSVIRSFPSPMHIILTDEVSFYR